MRSIFPHSILTKLAFSPSIHSPFSTLSKSYLSAAVSRSSHPTIGSELTVVSGHLPAANLLCFLFLPALASLLQTVPFFWGTSNYYQLLSIFFFKSSWFLLVQFFLVDVERWYWFMVFAGMFYSYLCSRWIFLIRIYLVQQGVL